MELAFLARFSGVRPASKESGLGLQHFVGHRVSLSEEQAKLHDGAEGVVERMRKGAADVVLPESQQTYLLVIDRLGCCVRLLF